MKPKLLVSDMAEILGCTVQNVHALIKKHNIKVGKAGNRLYLLDPSQAKKILNLKKGPFFISVQTSKGGVGKTPISCALAVRLWMYGLRILFVDLDQQGNSTKYFLKDSLSGRKYTGNVLLNVLEGKTLLKDCIQTAKKGLDVLPSSQRNANISNHMIAYGLSPSDTLRDLLDNVKEKYDVIMFDTPPAICHINASAIHCSNLIISPVTPDDDAIDGMLNVFNEVNHINSKRKEKIDFQILLTNIDYRKTLSSKTLQQIEELTRKGLESRLLDTVLRTDQSYMNCKASGDSLYETVSSKNPAGRDIHSLSLEILNRI